MRSPGFNLNLEGRVQRIFVKGSVLNRFALECGVKRGSCLGPLFFTIYTSKLFEILRLHLTFAHAYADDIQLYDCVIHTIWQFDSLNNFEAVTALENSILDVCAWMREGYAVVKWWEDGVSIG